MINIPVSLIISIVFLKLKILDASVFIVYFTYCTTYVSPMLVVSACLSLVYSVLFSISLLLLLVILMLIMIITTVTL